MSPLLTGVAESAVDDSVASASLRSLLLPLAAACITFVLLLIVFPGTWGGDEMEYAARAHWVLTEGLWTSDPSHKVGRIGVYLPLAALFRAFGVSPLTLAVIPMVCTAATAACLLLLGRRFFSTRVGIVSVGLFAIFPSVLIHGSALLPEPIAGFELSLAALLFFHRATSGRREVALKYAAGIAVGVAYLTTEPSALMLPVLLIIRYLSRRLTVTDWAAVAGFGTVLLLELSLYGALYGNPLHRFTGLGGEYSRDSMVMAANVDLVDRLFMAYPRKFLLFNADFGVHGLLFIAGGLVALWQLERSLPFVIWSGAFLCFYNFGSARPTEYLALPVATRLIYLGCLPLIVLAAVAVARVWNWGSGAPLQRTAVRSALVVMLLAVGSASAFAAYLSYNTRVVQVVTRTSEAAARKLASEPAVCVQTDERTAGVLRFYRGFRSGDTFHVIGGAANDLGFEQACRNRCFIVVSGAAGGIENARGQQPSIQPDLSRDRPFPDAQGTSRHPLVFEWSYRRSEEYARLMDSALAHYAMGTGHETARDLLLDAGASGWVRMYDCSR